MCGICGISFSNGSADAASITRMMDVLLPRGPNGAAQMISGRVGLGHRDDKAVTRRVVAAAGVRVPEQMETGPERRAVEAARQFSKRVIIEAMVDGTDLRILVIDHKGVATAGTQRLHHAADGRGSGKRFRSLGGE